MNIYIYVLFLLIFSISCTKEQTEEQKAQENLEEIRYYIKQQGLNPNDIRIELTDPIEAANSQVVKELKKKVDSYVKERKIMEDKFERMIILREKMKKAKTKEDVENLVKEYPDLFITPNSPRVLKMN